ncbi:Cytochrome b-c1 complex subunit [Lachnellula subtilissima]|uniref:Cytochrome b-c1 complex subunit 8 n=1 Tax=Lachnellula subtilissima TaxID=602034 RepID=A0A8H8RPM0_9HELO|nr:Cytochrome b-c1 complex subunit [Lachnellula subtilissima]
MRPSQILRSGGDGEIGKYGKYLGGWGNFGSQPQKGVISFGLSANRQRPLAGTLNAAIFNVWRRFSHQVLYIAPPMIIAYLAMDWAIERNEYLNSKPGRLEYGEEE